MITQSAGRKFLTRVLMGVVAGMLFFPHGIAATAQEKVVLKAWHSQGVSYTRTFKKILARFNEKVDPNIKIEFAAQPYRQVEDKFIAAYLTGTGPDLWLDDSLRLIPIESRYQTWEDLQPWINQDPEFEKRVKGLQQAALDQCQMGGKLYTLPTSVTPCLLFVRESWKNKFGFGLPQDWEETREMATAFQFKDPNENGKDDTIGFFMNLEPHENFWEHTGYWIKAAGIEQTYMDETGKILFTKKDRIEVMSIMRDWIFKYKIAPLNAANLAAGDLYNAVKAKKVGIGRCGSWNPPMYDESLNKDYIVFPWPPKTTTQTEPAYQGFFFHGISLNNHSPHKKEAIKFIKFFIGKEAQTMYYADQGMAAQKDLDWNKLVGDNPRQAAFIKPMSLVATWKAYPWTSIYRKHLSPTFSQIFSDPGANIKKLLEEAAEKIRSEMEKKGMV